MVGWHLGVLFLIVTAVWVRSTLDELEKRDPIGFTLWLAVLAVLLFAVVQSFLRPYEFVILV